MCGWVGGACVCGGGGRASRSSSTGRRGGEASRPSEPPPCCTARARARTCSTASTASPFAEPWKTSPSASAAMEDTWVKRSKGKEQRGGVWGQGLGAGAVCACRRVRGAGREGGGQGGRGRGARACTQRRGGPMHAHTHLHGQVSVCHQRQQQLGHVVLLPPRVRQALWSRARVCGCGVWGVGGG